MSYKKSLILSASIIAGNFMALAPAASAQSEDSVRIDEVTVSARKREESLQDVPLAVTALDAQALEDLHISVITDIDKLVPNIDLADNPFAGQALGATIRGVGFSDLEKSFEPAVGFSVDGVFLANNTGAAIDGFDIEQIEVLRGPQGTLFGRNTVGGVINVTRSRPTGEAGLKLGTRIGNHAVKEYNAVANLPQFADVLSTKAYVFSKESDTFAKNTLTGRKEKQTDSLAYGASFLYEPSDRLEALISIDAFDDDSNGPPTYSNNVASTNFGDLMGGAGLVVNVVENNLGNGDLFCDIPNLFFFSAGTIGCGADLALAEANGFETFGRTVPFKTVIDGWSVTSNIEYQLNDNLTLTSITGYRETDEQLLEENVGGPQIPGAELLVQNRVQDANQFSQELRVSGNLGDKLDFVTGVYFLDAEYELTGGNFANGSFGNTLSIGSIAAVTETAQQSQAYAIFVDGTYDITDRLSFSGGLRYSYEEKDFQNEYIFASPENSFTAPSVANPVIGQTVDLSEDWDEPTWRGILQYDVNDDAMIYGGYSRGFRSGGFNGRAASPASSGPYDPETVDSFEIGARVELWDNRIRINPTAFYTDYQDKQEENLNSVAGSSAVIETFVENASEVTIQGAELEILARVTPELTLRGAFGYTDAEFDEFIVADLDADPTGATLIDVADSRNLRAGPESTASVGAAYSRPIFNGDLQLTLNADYSYQDEVNTSASSDPLGLGRGIIDSINSTDFSVTVETLNAGTNFKLSAFINDAFDDDVGRVGNEIVIPGTFTFATGAPTKIYGFEATVEF